MAKLIYDFEGDSREANVIEFTIPDDLNIYEFRTVCIRMASAMGYTDTTIKKAFDTSDYETQEDIDFRQFMKSLMGTTTGSLQTIY